MMFSRTNLSPRPVISLPSSSSSSSSPNSFVLFSLYLMLLLSGGAARIKLPDNAIVPAVIAFGDSIVDQGNNNNLLTVVKCNFPPYGKDFSGGIPTGRFCNGKTPPDFLAKELGIKELVPAYRDPKLQANDLRTGVSFASGGSGFDPQTPQTVSVLPLSEQLQMFKEYIGKLKEVAGEEETQKILENSIFLVVAGSDDLANTYFTIGLRRLHYDVNSYADLLVQQGSNFVQELHKLGARRIAFFNSPPIGCLPSQRTLAGGIVRQCNEKYNEAAQLYNNKLSTALHSLNSSLSDSKTRVVYIDIYNPLLDLIQNHDKYGFSVVDKGCCGTGSIEVAILCNKFSPTCQDSSKYLFWDSYHPTEKGYRLIVNRLIRTYLNSFL